MQNAMIELFTNVRKVRLSAKFEQRLLYIVPPAHMRIDAHGPRPFTLY